jgi:enamine deaminase RidA (YjgF/YER057c/UK114 family)
MPLYAGMTVNERLVISGQIAAWDAAVARRDRAGMIEILTATELNAEQAAQTADTTLGEKYGYPPMA